MSLRRSSYLALAMSAADRASGGLGRRDQRHADETELTEEFLNDPGADRAGARSCSRAECSQCHGKSAYPGKAPKLNPKKLTPEDVYLRMPTGCARCRRGRTCFTDEELMAITAYVKSNRFSELSRTTASRALRCARLASCCCSGGLLARGRRSGFAHDAGRPISPTSSGSPTATRPPVPSCTSAIAAAATARTVGAAPTPSCRMSRI